ncbi:MULTISPECIES: HAD-IA family hydrolase [unclassified Streptomyces]|uniref:HAD-IA family hydrolase n=1 Tax=unclassified Streptomyces TaxID=2593676 RepID=UPI0024732473|nr:MULTISPECIES: HAD-IA family hydrolase [unclassified Streptomyces]MDH6451116.1 beta-phosphoglucomutase-like phosphatase (HAD superfamily) [Streptomyces sp. SAI-119]MDH6498329.1 beta-phosphoglucomutase-like phosphatase (HAD superfamily) [Streptomyces sp. SAI-149]
MSDAIDDQEAVFQLLTGAQAVLFDFDGPVCDLFGGAPTKGVADKVKRKARRYWRRLDREVEECHDSHGVLRRLRDMYDRSEPKPRFRRPLALAERTVTRQERGAVKTAVRTPGVVTLVDLLLELGLPLVVVSNNAEGPIRKYLKDPELKGKFTDVCGRDPKDAGRMKPDPDCVRRALDRLSLDASACVLIGDQLTDLEAARSAGTPFIGFTQDTSRAKRMVELKADAVVTSYGPVIASAEQFLKDREASAEPLSPAGR